jgi:hypothetical protein
MKILSNKTWDSALDLINEKDRQIMQLEDICKRQQKLIEAQRRFISAHLSAQDIDFPNTQKGGFEDSNIFLL